MREHDNDQRTLPLTPRSERTAPTARLCAGCGVVDLRDRRPDAKFCSDRCRADGARRDQQLIIVAILDEVQRLLDYLRREVV